MDLEYGNVVEPAGLPMTPLKKIIGIFFTLELVLMQSCYLRRGHGMQRIIHRKLLFREQNLHRGL
jgi:hypothetical protein